MTYGSSAAELGSSAASIEKGDLAGRFPAMIGNRFSPEAINRYHVA
jgi:hypothetical protein